MEVYGQLAVAGYERLAADPTGLNLFRGRFWHNTTANNFKVYDGTTVHTFADLVSAQTFANKVLQGANIADYLEFDQAAAPTNPAAGKHRIYFKADGTPYTLDSAGNETPLGSGSGGSKNYFEDVDAEVDSTIGSWATDDGAGSASPGLSLAVTAVAGEVLAGNNSLKITKDAADRNGHFVKVLSKTIDPSDRGRANYGSFEFRPLAGYVSGDLVWEVYDVTNAAVLYSGVADELELLNVRGRFNWVTYLEETTAQVEFRLKINNTNTNGFDVVADEFKFGPSSFVLTKSNLKQVIVQGSVSVPNNTNTIAPFDTIVLDKSNLISGNTIVAPKTGLFKLTGFASYQSVSSGNRFFDVNINGSGVSRPLSTAGTPSTTTRHSFHDVLELNEGDVVRFEFRQATGATETCDFELLFEEVEATKNLVSNNELSQQTLTSAAGLQAPTGAIASSFSNAAIFGNLHTNDANAYNTSTGQWIAPKTGRVDVKAQLEFGYAATSNIISGVEFRNVTLGTVLVRGTDGHVGVNGNTYPSCQGTIPVIKGHVYEIRSFCSAPSPSYTTGFAGSNFSIRYVPDYKLLGVVKNEEYLETIITVATTTVTGGVYADVTGSEITLSPGTWDLGYDVDARARNNTGVLNTNIGTIRMTESDNTLVENSESTLGGVMGPDTDVFTSHSKVLRVTITEETTYKLQVGSSDGTVNGDMTVFASGSLSGTLSGDNATSRVWARRVK